MSAPATFHTQQYISLLKPPAGVPVPPDNYYNYVKIAEPMVVGDTLNGQYRIVGMNPSFFGYDDHGNPLPPDDVMDYRPGEKLHDGRGARLRLQQI